MEKLRNRIDVKLVSNLKDYLNWISKPSYISHKIFDNDLVAIRINKVNKRVYIGMCILESSKVLMYEFYYDYILSNYGHNSRLLFTDTDNFIYKIKTEYLYEDLSNDKEMFEFMIIQTN